MIKVQETINAPIENVWDLWTLPKHITKWNNASQDWHTPHAENDLKVGGKFKFTMALKDGSEQFDFEGIYTKIEKFSEIEYKLFDNRTSNISFENEGKEVRLTEIFEPTTKNSADMEKQFCSAILQSFKEYVENFKE